MFKFFKKAKEDHDHKKQIRELERKVRTLVRMLSNERAYRQKLQVDKSQKNGDEKLNKKLQLYRDHLKVARELLSDAQKTVEKLPLNTFMNEFRVALQDSNPEMMLKVKSEFQDMLDYRKNVTPVLTRHIEKMDDLLLDE